MNMPNNLRSLLASIAAALPLLISAAPASAGFQVQIPMNPGAPCAGGACAGGGGAPLALALVPDPTGQMNPTVTTTGGKAPYTYSMSIAAWSPLYGYETAPAWDACTPSSLNGTIFVGSVWGNGLPVADCVPASTANVSWTPSTITTTYDVVNNYLEITPFLYYTGAANSASMSGNGWQFRVQLTVTDSKGQSATSTTETVQIPGF